MQLSSALLPGRHRRYLVGGRPPVGGFEICLADDFEILHVGRVIVEIVPDARPLMDDITGLYQCRLVLVHEPRPALGHDDDLEIAIMAMPAGTVFPRPFRIGLDQMADHLTASGAGDAEVAVQEKFAQSPSRE